MFGSAQQAQQRLLIVVPITEPQSSVSSLQIRLIDVSNRNLRVDQSGPLNPPNSFVLPRHVANLTLSWLASRPFTEHYSACLEGI